MAAYATTLSKIESVGEGMIEEGVEEELIDVPGAAASLAVGRELGGLADVGGDADVVEHSTDGVAVGLRVGLEPLVEAGARY